MIWMKRRVRPWLFSRTVSTSRASPGRKRSSPIRRRGPLGISRMPVASTTRTPGSPSAKRADQRHRREVLAEVLAVHAADRLDLSLVEVGVEHVDRELDDVGELAARGGDDGAEVLAHLTELGDQVARTDDPPLRILRDLAREEQEPPAVRLDAVGVADGSHERRRVVELDVPRHGLLPSSTIVSPVVAVSSRSFRAAAA